MTRSVHAAQTKRVDKTNQVHCCSSFNNPGKSIQEQAFARCYSNASRLSLSQRLQCLSTKPRRTKPLLEAAAHNRNSSLRRLAAGLLPNPPESKSSPSSILTETLWAPPLHSDLKNQTGYYRCQKFLLERQPASPVATHNTTPTHLLNSKPSAGPAPPAAPLLCSPAGGSPHQLLLSWVPQDNKDGRAAIWCTAELGESCSGEEQIRGCLKEPRCHLVDKCGVTVFIASV